MTERTLYRVLRHMEGDKLYAPGDERELDAIDARHLLALGVIEKVSSDDTSTGSGEPDNSAGSGEPATGKIEEGRARKVDKPAGRKAAANGAG